MVRPFGVVPEKPFHEGSVEGLDMGRVLFAPVEALFSQGALEAFSVRLRRTFGTWALSVQQED